MARITASPITPLAIEGCRGTKTALFPSAVPPAWIACCIDPIAE